MKTPYMDSSIPIKLVCFCLFVFSVVGGVVFNYSLIHLFFVCLLFCCCCLYLIYSFIGFYIQLINLSIYVVVVVVFVVALSALTVKLALITGRMNIPSSITGNLFLRVKSSQE